MAEKVFVMSLNDHRWKGAAENVCSWGAVAVRIDAIDPTDIDDVGKMTMRSNIQGMSDGSYRRRQLAIIRGMRHVADRLVDNGGGIFMQDHARFTSQPRHGDADVTLLDVPRPDAHRCPVAFSCSQIGAERLYEAWQNETRSVCDSWKRIVTPMLPHALELAVY